MILDSPDVRSMLGEPSMKKVNSGPEDGHIIKSMNSEAENSSHNQMMSNPTQLGASYHGKTRDKDQRNEDKRSNYILGNEYWDNMLADSGGQFEPEDAETLESKISDLGIFESAFKSSSKTKKSFPGNKGYNEFEIGDLIKRFLQPGDSTHFLNLGQLCKNEIAWLWTYLEISRKRAPTPELQDIESRLDQCPSWEHHLTLEIKKVELLNDGRSLIENYRRVQAFRNQIYPHFTLMMWQNAKRSATGATKSFVSDFKLDKPESSFADSPEKEIKRFKKRYGSMLPPNGVIDSFPGKYVRSVMFLFKLRDKQLNSNCPKSFFGGALLKKIEIQGICPERLLHLEIILELSLETVSWSKINLQEKLEKFKGLVYVIAGYPLRNYQPTIFINQFKQDVLELEGNVILQTITRSPELSTLVKTRAKLLIEAVYEMKSQTFEALFFNQEAKPWAKLKVPYHEVLEAALSGITLGDLGTKKFTERKTPKERMLSRNSTHPKQCKGTSTKVSWPPASRK